MKIDIPPLLNKSGFSLRQLVRADIEAWYEYLKLPEVYEQTSWNLHSSKDLLPLFEGFESESMDSPRRLAIVDDQTKSLVGTIGFHTVSDINRTAEIAYDFSPRYWGRGLATVACNTITTWSFEEYGFLRVQATVLQMNARSKRVIERCGFSYEGVLRSFRLVRGTPKDFDLYSRLSTD